MIKQRALIFNLLVIFAFCNSTLLNAQVIRKSKQLTKTFPVSNMSEVGIVNKYGNINIITWDKDSVRFDIELEVKGSKQAKVDKTFNLIDFEFESTKYYATAKTVFIGNSFWSDVSDKSSNFFGSKTTANIVYNVYMPSTIIMNISNKYGNVYISDYSGKLNVELSNGDFKANNLLGYTIINSEFGSCDIQKIDEGKLTMKYGGLYLEQGNHLTIESKSSEFHLTTIGEMNINSRRDRFFISQLGSLKGSSDYTRLEIEHITKNVDFSAKYGDIVIRDFGDDMKSFKLKTDNSNTVLHFIDDKQYDLDIMATDDTRVYYASTITNIKNSEVDGDDKLIKVDCVVGNSSKKIGPLKISADSGTLSLKRK